jgi:hypothetical protein
MTKRLPKKLKDAFQQIREGSIAAGIHQTSHFEKDFKNHIAIALAEVNAFQHNWKETYENITYFLPFHDSWYYVW